MSFSIFMYDRKVYEGDWIELAAHHPVHVQSMDYAVIRHNMKVRNNGGRPMIIYPLPGIFARKSLIINPSVIFDGDVITEILNFGVDPIHIVKGEIVSGLAAL